MTEIGNSRALLRMPRLKFALGQSEVDVDNLGRQVREGLREPLGFPGFNKFLFGGDRVVLAIHAGLHRVELVLKPFIDELLAAGNLEQEQIKLLFADRESADHFSATSEFRSLAVSIHEGTSDQSLALLGADDGHSPVLINRLIFDADVLIPIVPASDGLRELTQPMLWDFVDSGTKKRWRGQLLKQDEHYCKQVADLAGVMVVMQVLVGPGEFPYGALMGQPSQIEPIATKLMGEIWQIRAPEQMDVLVAMIEDKRDRSSWQAIRDAVVIGAGLGPHFPILVISDVAAPPPNELRGVFAPQVSRARTPSFDPALQSAVEGRTIYLCSKLDSAVVRDLGMMSIGDEDEILSLLARFSHPVVLRDPQRAQESRADHREFNQPTNQVEPATPSASVLVGRGRTRPPAKRPKTRGTLGKKQSKPRRRKTS